MSTWDFCVNFFSSGVVPGSQYAWIITICAVAAIGFVVARKMVSKI